MKKKIDKKKVIIISLIVIVMITVISKVIKNTYAYYGNNNELPLINTTIGNFAVEELSKEKLKYDIDIVLYMEDAETKYRYHIVQNTPVMGYEVNKEKSECNPKDASYSNYTIKDDGTIVINVSEKIPNKIVCKIYYDKKKNADIITYALVEDAKGYKEYNGKKYIVVNSIPSEEEYTYDTSICLDDNVITSVIYDSNTKSFNYTTNGMNTCYAYFNKKG